MSAPKGSGLSFDVVEKSSKTLLTSLNVERSPESQKYVLPLATGSGNSGRVKFDKHVYLPDRVKFFSDAVHGISKNIFGKTTVKILATEQIHDVVHVFNTAENMDMGDDPRASSVDSESIDSSAALGGKTSASNLGESDPIRWQNYACSPTPEVKHRGAGGCAVTDDTVVPVM